ncbi:hypothetical protein ACOSQ2_027732 [Xanthoceras sorbifolium]
MWLSMVISGHPTSDLAQLHFLKLIITVTNPFPASRNSSSFSGWSSYFSAATFIYHIQTVHYHIQSLGQLVNLLLKTRRSLGCVVWIWWVVRTLLHEIIRVTTSGVWRKGNAVNGNQALIPKLISLRIETK